MPAESLFREDKVTQAASIILDRSGGTIKHLKLIKLLYLADRKAFDLWERPITYDHYVSMDHGPVLSKTYDLIKGDFPGSNGYWSDHITRSGRYNVRLLKEPSPEKLSRAEVDIIIQTYNEFGWMDVFVLCDLTHQLPEYRDPHGSSIPIPVQEILSALGYEDEDIKRVMDEMDEEAFIDELLGG